MVAPYQQLPPWLMLQQTAPGMRPPWAADWAQAGAPPPPPPPVAAPNLWQQATGQMSQTPVWQNPAARPPTQTTSWAQVPNAAEAPWQYQPASQMPANFGLDYARQSVGDTPGNQPLGPLSPTSPPHMPDTTGLNNTQAKLGLPETGAPGVNAPVLATTGGPADPSWQAIGAGMIRNGWGLDPQGARQNNGIIVGYGSPHQKTIIMPTDYAYNADTARWEVAGAGVENAMQRALRKTADEMQFNPGLNSMQVLAKWMRFVDNEARQQGKASGFNMGQMGGQGMDPTAGKPTGGNTAVGAPPTVPPGAPGGPASMPAPPQDPKTGGPGGTGPDNTGGGNTGGTLRNFGQFQTDDLAFMLQQAADDPVKAAMLLRAARGQNGRSLGRMGNDRDKLYGNAFATALAMAGNEGFGGMDTMAGEFLNNAVLGNNLAGYGSDMGRKIGNMNFEGISSDVMQEMLRGGMAMQGINMGSMGQSVQQGRLADIIYADVLRGLQSSENDSKNFADLLKGSAFQRTMQNFR